jgi:hypothetical protein
VAKDVTEGANRKFADRVKAIMGSNSTCCECGAGDPTWISINLGVVFCLECSGIHRGLGVGVSKVRATRGSGERREDDASERAEGSVSEASSFERSLFARAGARVKRAHLNGAYLQERAHERSELI